MTKGTTVPTRQRPLAQAPFMLMAAVALLAALWGGLQRLAWHIPAVSAETMMNHGPLMINGFLGTVITLERAVALGRNQGGRKRYMVAPILSALGALALLLKLPPEVSRGLFVGSALGLVYIFVVIYRMQAGPDHAVLGLAAALWLGGNILWLTGWPIPRVVAWWAGFLVLTIAAERLELTRIMLMTKIARQTFMAVVGLFVAGLVLALPLPDIGLRVAGLGLFALGVWLIRFDIAKVTIRRKDLTRYIAACLLPGYFWLLVSGTLWMVYGATYSSGQIYDALLHTVFLGFVISMILGHAPVIIPAVMGVKIPYKPVFYVHLVLLHVSLVLRVYGDLAGNFPARQWGGMLNEVAVLLFLITTIIAARMGPPKARPVTR
ncbi:MAG TPA: hypothetical protein PKJ56_04425 [Promineifilum sp.]|nr:hypothetical protein [Promineifilum sp.]